MGQRRIPDQPQLHSTIESDGYDTLAQKNNDGAYELSVLVNGVHCAGCIQKIESTLAREQDVSAARLNFSTHRLAVTWDGDALRANDYVKLIEELGYDVQPFDPQAGQDENAREEKFLLICLGVAGFAVGNVMLLSVGVWSSTAETMGMATRDLLHWVSAAIALPAIMFSGRPFFRSALKALSAGHTNMDVPISVALILACGMSVFEVIHHGEHVYFDSAVMLMFFLLVGRYLDFHARKSARSSATDLLSAFSGFATLVEGRKTRRIPVRDLQEGMTIRVAAGEKFPADGMVVDGISAVDTSLVTGETLPHDVQMDSYVYAGTLNISTPLLVRIEQAAENSLLSDIVKLMEKAGQSQAQYVRLADKIARLYTPVVHSFAVAAFLGWWILGGLLWQDALMISITVLVITCPCALGLAVPVVQVLASGRLMKNGVLVKSGDALERLADADIVLLDKTGTLTHGQPQLDQAPDGDALQIAASLASHSTHPLSLALSADYEGALFDVTDVKEHAGMGLEGTLNGHSVKLGSRSWCGDDRAKQTDALELWLSVEGQQPQVFYFTDHLRSDAAETINRFKRAGIQPIIVSGDRKAVVENVARDVGVDVFYAEKTPPEKFEILEELKSQGHKILMIGDGLNDAPVLAGADVSIAPGNAIHMAQNAADIIFMGEAFAPTFEAVRVAKTSNTLVKQNFALAIIYNIIAIPLALCGLVTPFIAAIAMSGSSLVVVANSFRLRFKP